tara:strand:- start:622 stop:852 length:231 start_codon:yes stop_codon:yes gene_type:complete
MATHGVRMARGSDVVTDGSAAVPGLVVSLPLARIRRDIAQTIEEGAGASQRAATAPTSVITTIGSSSGRIDKTDTS